MKDTMEIARESIEKLSIREQAEDLGCSLAAMKYIIYLEGRIRDIEGRKSLPSRERGLKLEHSDGAHKQVRGY